MKTRIRIACIVSFLVALASVSPAQTRDEKLWKKALKLHRDAIVIDTHSDTTSRILDDGFDMGARSSEGHMDLSRIKEGGLDAEFFAIYVAARYAREGGAARRALDMIDVVYDQARRHPESMEMAFSSADIRRIAKKRKLATLMGIEGGHAIEDSLHALRMFYQLGVRYMTLTHTNTNNWADSSGDEPKHNGLTDFGRQVVREMNRIGMLADISHVSDKTFWDVIEVSRAPVIASHSSARALANHPRNMTDEMLRAVAKNGGVVMVNFYAGFLDQAVIDATELRRKALAPQLAELRRQYANTPQKLREEAGKLNATMPLPRTPLSVLIDHIDHVVKVAGIDHAGLGSDFDGVDALPEEMEDCSKLPRITSELLKRGYSEENVRKILGGNFLRVFARAEEVARQMQTETQR